MNSQMLKEALESPQVIQRQIDNWSHISQQLPSSWSHGFTFARGSSDHAAQYLGYTMMNHTGRPITSLPMSLINQYHSPLRLNEALSIALSQSGQSPDLLNAVQEIKKKGALTLGLVNDENSPLAKTVDLLLPLMAGPEQAVAATKTVMAQISISALWSFQQSNNIYLMEAFKKLPDFLLKSQLLNGDPFVDFFQNKNQAFIVGRGYGLPLAYEVALKFKETCGLHAEAFSSAEVQHGPKALLEKDFPVLILALPGPTYKGLVKTAQELKSQGSPVLILGTTSECELQLPTSSHEEMDVLILLQAIYTWLPRLSQSRGLNPDRPQKLSKITLTE